MDSEFSSFHCYISAFTHISHNILRKEVECLDFYVIQNNSPAYDFVSFFQDIPENSGCQVLCQENRDLHQVFARHRLDRAESPGIV